MESKDPISKRYVYEPGLEDGITNDYLAELEKFGYRTEDVNVKMPECKTPEIQTESEPAEKEEIEAPFGWVLLHGNGYKGECPRMMVPVNDIRAICETEDNGTAILLKWFNDAETTWHVVNETFEEVVKKVNDARKGAAYAVNWKV